jgi:signal transduction histidine kinase
LNFITRVLDICLTGQNDLIFASSFLGIGRLTVNGNITWYKYTEDNDLLYSGITVDNQGNTWVGTTKGLFKFENGKIFRDERVSKEVYVRKFFCLKDGSLALCTSNNGVIVISEENVTVYKSDNQETNSVYSIYEDDNGLVFAGTFNGLYYLKNNVLEKYEKGLFNISRPTFFINKDLDGNLWFGTDNGVIKWNGKTHILYNPTDGLAGYETNRSAFKIDKSGKIWIGTDNGLSCYNSEFDTYKIIKPTVDILYLEDASSKKIDTKNPVTLDYNQNNFSLHYRGYSFIDEKSLMYRVKIHNKTTGWKDDFITANNKVRFSSLTPGIYTFSVSVKNSQGVWGDPLESSTIKISKPFYSQSWFYVLNIIIGVTVVYFIHHFITQKRYSIKLENAINERTKELMESEKDIRNLTQELIKSQENERQRISYELHDNLAQDLSTSKIILDSINNGASQSKDIKKIILQASSLLKKSLMTVRDLSYYLRLPELEDMSFSDAVQLFCNDFSKKYNININYCNSGVESLRLGYDTKINLYRIIQEALTNVRKHSGAEEVSIKLVASSPFIILRVEDNGKGFDVNQQLLKANKHMGIKNIKDRVKLLNGSVTFKSIPGKGTKIYVEIQYEEERINRKNKDNNY